MIGSIQGRRALRLASWWDQSGVTTSSHLLAKPGVVKPSGPVIDAEQALLGALLSEPSRHRHLLELLTPGDMFRPYHGQVLAAMQRLHRRGSPAAEADKYAEQVRQELAGDPDLRPQVALDGSLLHTLM